MIKHLISGLIMIVFVIGGAIAADALKPAPKGYVPSDSGSKATGHGQSSKEGHDETAGSHEAEEKPAKEKKEKKKGGHGAEEAVEEVNYYKFNRQFIVPVVEGSEVQSLVMLELNLDVESGLLDRAYSLEPKLRDSIMTELLALSNEGYFSARMTDPEAYAEMRERLLEAARRPMPEGIKEVLILDLARQDQ